jgi:hypothetical protein
MTAARKTPAKPAAKATPATTHRKKPTLRPAAPRKSAAKAPAPGSRLAVVDGWVGNAAPRKPLPVPPGWQEPTLSAPLAPAVRTASTVEHGAAGLKRKPRPPVGKVQTPPDKGKATPKKATPAKKKPAARRPAVRR